MPSSTSRFFDIQFPTIPLSGFSADFTAKRGVLYAMWVPVVDSCAVTLRSSWDQTSANYLPLMQSAGSLEWTLSRGLAPVPSRFRMSRTRSHSSASSVGAWHKQPYARFVSSAKPSEEGDR
jgi:hypothetical protein